MVSEFLLLALYPCPLLGKGRGGEVGISAFDLGGIYGTWGQLGRKHKLLPLGP